MNKWQMEGRQITSRRPGIGVDDKGRQHISIHPGKDAKISKLFNVS